MKKKIMIIIGLSLLMSQFIYADANMDRLLNEARKRQAEEKAGIQIRTVNVGIPAIF